MSYTPTENFPGADLKEDPFKSPPAAALWGVPRPETLSKLDMYKFVDSFLSDEEFAAELQALEMQLAAPELEQQVRIDQEIKARYAEFGKHDDYLKDRRLSNEIAALRTEAEGDMEAHIRFTTLSERKRYLTDFKQRRIDPNSREARLLVDAITQASHEQGGELPGNPPFAEYYENTGEAWAYVSRADARSFLATKEFMEVQFKGDWRSGYIVIKPGDKTTLAVPANIFINAAGFDSWLGRHGTGKYYGSTQYGWKEGSSMEAMKHYAGLPSDLPPIHEAVIYVQPNGKIFASNGEGDSHRIGAALLRGKDNIQAESLRIMKANYNYI